MAGHSRVGEKFFFRVADSVGKCLDTFAESAFDADTAVPLAARFIF
jgi:hypothetical protein